jgi:hypothetical protein
MALNSHPTDAAWLAAVAKITDAPHLISDADLAMFAGSGDRLHLERARAARTKARTARTKALAPDQTSRWTGVRTGAAVPFDVV